MVEVLLAARDPDRAPCGATGGRAAEMYGRSEDDYVVSGQKKKCDDLSDIRLRLAAMNHPTTDAFFKRVILSLSYAHRVASGALHREMPDRT